MVQVPEVTVDTITKVLLIWIIFSGRGMRSGLDLYAEQRFAKNMCEISSMYVVLLVLLLFLKSHEITIWLASSCNLFALSIK